jgi:hypothetical protein
MIAQLQSMGGKLQRALEQSNRRHQAELAATARQHQQIVLKAVIASRQSQNMQVGLQLRQQLDLQNLVNNRRNDTTGSSALAAAAAFSPHRNASDLSQQLLLRFLSNNSQQMYAANSQLPRNG